MHSDQGWLTSISVAIILDQAGAESLAQVLGQCAALAHLNLGDNAITTGGAERLAEVLAQCTALAHLDLNCNNIGAGGADDGDSAHQRAND